MGIVRLAKRVYIANSISIDEVIEQTTDLTELLSDLKNAIASLNLEICY